MGVINSELLLEELNKKLQEPSYQHKGEDWYNGIMTANGANIEGNITATSLIISNNGSTYNVTYLCSKEHKCVRNKRVF